MHKCCQVNLQTATPSCNHGRHTATAQQHSQPTQTTYKMSINQQISIFTPRFPKKGYRDFYIHIQLLRPQSTHILVGFSCGVRVVTRKSSHQSRKQRLQGYLLVCCKSIIVGVISLCLGNSGFLATLRGKYAKPSEMVLEARAKWFPRQLRVHAYACVLVTILTAYACVL